MNNKAGYNKNKNHKNCYNNSNNNRSNNRTNNNKTNNNRTNNNKTNSYNNTNICPVAKKCGGCQYIGMDYEKTLLLKQKHIENLLGEFGSVDKIISMDNPYNYRNKVCATFHHRGKGDIISGIYQEGTHKVIPIDNCFIEDKKADEIIVSIRSMLKSFKITVYNEDTGYGLLRHVLVRTARSTNQIMVILVTSGIVFPSKKNFAKALKSRHPEITTIIQNINPDDTTMVLGKRNETIYGRGYIEDILCGKRFRLSPNSFYQVNPAQTEKLYSLAMKYAGLTGKETVIDAYCGIGTLGIVASDSAASVLGVELNKDAVHDAINNARRNSCNNIKFIANDAGKYMVEMANAGQHADIVFMDPPRSGSTNEFIDALHKLAPLRIVYISCGPESLKRDLLYFRKKNVYKIKKICPVDMFAFTREIETCVLLSRI